MRQLMQGKRLNDSTSCKDRDLVDDFVEIVSMPSRSLNPNEKKDRKGKERVRFKRDVEHESERRFGGKKASRSA